MVETPCLKEACKVISASKIAVTQCSHLVGMFCRLSENVSHLLTPCYVCTFACNSIWVVCKCLFGLQVALTIFCHLDNPINNKLWLIHHLIHLYLLSDILSPCFTVRNWFEFEIACIYIQTCDEIVFHWSIVWMVVNICHIRHFYHIWMMAGNCNLLSCTLIH